MDPIEPWVDSAELRRLADALLANPAAQAAPPNDASYGEEFVGFTGTEEDDPTAPAEHSLHGPDHGEPRHPSAGQGTASGIEDQARNALATARSIAQRGGLLASAGAPPPREGGPVGEPPPPPAQLTEITPLADAALPPVVSHSPFLTRLQAYGTWLREGIQAKSFFVTDRDGAVLIDEMQSPKLQQVARTLAQASRTANRQAGAAAIGNLHIKVAPETVLEVVPVTTSYGPLILGILVDRPISGPNIETVARGLQQVIDGNPGP